MTTTTYSLPFDATTTPDDVIAFAREAGVTFTNVRRVNDDVARFGDDVTYTFDATCNDMTRYAAFYDVDLDA